ncbi:MAG: DUF362 domain-containing protein [Bryobacterales bacterium]|nr:DUF362 domain-containing protein [Bryobacterales bacterium]
MTRREVFALLGGAAGIRAAQAPAAPVAVARYQSYDDNLVTVLSKMFDQIGGLDRLVKGKTVTVKLNLTGSPALRVEGRPLGVTHYTHPRTAGAMAHLLGRAGARRIRFVESCWATSGPLEEYLLDSGWNVRTLTAAASGVEFENTNALGKGARYARLKVPGGGLIFPAYDVNHSYQDTDVLVSLAKLKNHETCGVTLAMKNMFGITPASIYGDDAGRGEPNERPGKGRGETCHFGKRQPAASAPPELDPTSSRDPGHRMPRITAELNAARPIGIAFIDGIETLAGGEGPWNKGVRPVKPGLLILGTNAVSTDAVATALMGYDPRSPRGVPPFAHCDNTLLLAERLGLGSADLNKIEVRGAPVAESVYRFG